MQRLVCSLKISSPNVTNAMIQCDRKNYLREGNNRSCGLPTEPYEDSAMPIGYKVTISAPHMHAMCLSILEPYVCRPGSRVLDVGSGSGYLCGALALLGSEHNVTVYGIECVSPLVDISKANLKADGKQPLIEEGKITIVGGDGSQGLPDGAPYSAIHVGAAAPTIPKALVEQLASPGCMVIPVGPQGCTQELMVVKKDKEGKVTKSSACCVVYVPLHMDMEK